MPGTVYGYIRLEDEDEAEVDRLHDLLSAHAAAGGQALADVFVDRSMPPGQLIRPGLTLLLDAVRGADAATVIVPDLDHLSSLLAARRAIEAEISEAGARLIATAAAGDGVQAQPS